MLDEYEEMGEAGKSILAKLVMQNARYKEWIEMHGHSNYCLTEEEGDRCDCGYDELMEATNE